MKAVRVLVVLLGSLLACIIGVVTVLVLFPQRAKTAEWLTRFGLHPPQVHCAEFFGRRSLEMQSPPAAKGMIVSRDFRPDPLDLPLVRKDVGSKRMTVFAEYSGGRGDRRSLFFVLNDLGLIQLDVRFDTDYGSFVGLVNQELSNARVHEDELWFDLTLTMLDGNEHVERWQGKLSLN